MQQTHNETEELKYGYELTLSLARPGDPFSEEDRLSLEQAVAEYNQRSSSMANPKTISSLSVWDSYIRLRLYSTVALATPGRGLRTLTTILVNRQDQRFGKRVTAGGQLFRVMKIDNIKAQAAGESAPIAPALISDVALIKALIDCHEERIDGSSESRRKRAAMTEIKKIALEAGILS